MAKKNHELDDKIIQSAKTEFLKHGFDKASLHEIARNAHTTTGAIYTRYKGKDDLFASLVQEVLDAYKEMAPIMHQKYMEVQKSHNVESLMQIIHEEFHMYQRLLSEHYEACLLFYCRNQSSQMEKLVKDMMDQKIESTVAFFKSMSDTELDLDGIGILLLEQFHFFKEVLERGYDANKTIRCMEIVEMYQEAGWKKIFETIL